MARWQFQDFCKENPRNNEEFRQTVEKMITAEKKTQERFPDRNNRDNFNERYTRKDSKGNNKEDNQKKGDNHEDKGFQKSRGTVVVIFAGFPDSRSKHQEKLALRTIMAAEPATPRYLN